MLSMKGLQKERALVNKTIKRFRVCYKTHDNYPSGNRQAREVNRAIATRRQVSY
jgi:hypothetical protein